MIEADLGTGRRGTSGEGFFFFSFGGGVGRKEGDGVGMMMSLAGKTAELGVFRSFIQTAPGGDRQLQSLPYDPNSPTPKHPGLRVSLRWQVQTPPDFAKMAFLLRGAQKR